MINLTYKGNSFNQREDGFVNLGQLCAIHGKTFSHWYRLKNSKEYVVAVAETLTNQGIHFITPDEVVVKTKNDRGGDGATWGHPLVALEVARWISAEFSVWCNIHIKRLLETGETQLTPVQPANPQLPQLPPVNEETIKTYTESIQFFVGQDDLQLAQLIKVNFGNRLLKENQNNGQNQTADIVEYEGVVDVALRLGYSVPKNYESSLGAYVSKICGDLSVGDNRRYSAASGKQVPAKMYPAYDHEVECAVQSYCLKKAFRNRNVNLLAA